MKVTHFNGNGVAHTSTDEDGPCVVGWADVNQVDECEPGCDGWISAGVLFVPACNEIPPGTFIVDGLPIADTDDGESADWYEVSTGYPAVVVFQKVLIPPGYPDPVEESYCTGTNLKAEAS